MKKILPFAAVIFIMICAFVVNRRRVKILEATKLPYNPVRLEEVEDGIYTAETKTSFARVQLQIKVENHQITDVDVPVCDGLEVVKARDCVKKMVQNNNILIKAEKGQEIGTMVYISCASAAFREPESE